MAAGFERLHSALHVPLEHLPILTVLAFRQPPGHEMTTVLPLILHTVMITAGLYRPDVNTITHTCVCVCVCYLSPGLVQVLCQEMVRLHVFFYFGPRDVINHLKVQAHATAILTPATQRAPRECDAIVHLNHTRQTKPWWWHCSAGVGNNGLVGSDWHRRHTDDKAETQELVMVM